MMTEIDNAIKVLIEKSKNVIDSNDALKLTQASLNLSHVRSIYHGIEIENLSRVKL